MPVLITLLNFFFFHLSHHFNILMKKKMKYNFFSLLNTNSFFFFDIFFFYFFKKMKSNLKLKTIFIFNKNYFSLMLYQSSNMLLLFFTLFKKVFTWMMSMIVSVMIFSFLSNISLISLNKVFFEWFLMIMFIYWLLSGFTFFMKKYQFSKYTSVMQSFWKSSFIMFWLMEGGVFLTFFYLTLNSSEEIMYMNDQLKLFKMHLFSWKFFFLKIFLNILLMFISFFFIMALNWSSFKKINMYLLLITMSLVYFVWLEFYQFFHIMNFYSNLIWVFDYDEYIWNLEIEFSSTSVSNNYVAICLLAKFWHLMFIFMFWIFFMLSTNEMKSLSYPLLSANNQNFLIMYMMSWLYMYPWLKFSFSGFFDMNYQSFFNNLNKNNIKIFFLDLKLFYYSNFFYIWSKQLNLFKIDFFYFFYNSDFIIFSLKKHFLKNNILFMLN